MKVHTIYLLLLFSLTSCFNYHVQTNYLLDNTSIQDSCISGDISITCRRDNLLIPFILSFQGSKNGYQLTFYISSNDSLIDQITIENIEIFNKNNLIFKSNNIRTIEDSKFGFHKLDIENYSGIYKTDYIIPKKIKNFDLLDINIEIKFINKDGFECIYTYRNKLHKSKSKGFVLPV